MKNIFYKIAFIAIVFGGMVVGIIKGQDARNKWVSKMKFRYEDKKRHYKVASDPSLLLLDEIEIATWHS